MMKIISPRYSCILGVFLISSVCAEEELLCRQYVNQALVAIDSCLSAMEEALKSGLPDAVDYAGVDVFEAGFEISLSQGRSRRAGGGGETFDPYVVCTTSICGDLHIGNFFAYEHWPAESEAIPFLRAEHGHFERFYGSDDLLSFSHQRQFPITTLVFSREKGDLSFLECRSIPDDWW